MTENPDISLVVEWENTARTEITRTRRMLEILSNQVQQEIAESGSTFELIVLVNPEDTDEEFVRNVILEEWKEAVEQIEFALYTLPGGSYYEQKNLGAERAKGNIVVFIDCDVLPQIDWLSNILKPFENPDIGVSQGTTFVRPTGILTKGLALAWLFPLQKKDGTLTEQNRVIANNIAFRKWVIQKHPYPDLITWRGQCTEQRKKCEADGINVFWNEHARTEHPFPEGLLNTIERAFLNGHDHLTRYEMAGGQKRDWKLSYWRLATFIRRARTRRSLVKEELNISATGSLACDLIAIGYWGAAFFSEAMLHLWPNTWRRALKDLPKYESGQQSQLQRDQDIH